jgi:hypothetical protein
MLTKFSYFISQNIVLPKKEEFNLAFLTLCYSSNDCFNVLISAKAVEDRALEGCYAFSDYAVVYWLDYLECCIVKLDKSNTGLTELLVSEIREFLRKHFLSAEPEDAVSITIRERFNVFETYGFFSQLVRAAEFWKNCI